MTQKKIIFSIALVASILSFKETISMRTASSRNTTQSRSASTGRGTSSTSRGASSTGRGASSTSSAASGRSASTGRSSGSATGRSATTRNYQGITASSTPKMINANSQLLIQPGDVATNEITDVLTVQPETLLLHASIVTKEPMAQADYTNLINTQIKPLAQLIAECKETLQTSDTLTTTQIEGLKGRFILLLNTTPVLVKIPTLSNIISDARIISGQTALGSATIPVTIANLDANAYTNSQLGNIVLVSKKFITSSQFDILRVTHWEQKLTPLINQAKNASANSVASATLKNELKTILSTGWVNAFVPESTMPESILMGQNVVNAATIPVTTTNLTSLANDQFSKLVIKSVANLSKTQFDVLVAHVQANIAPNISNPDALKTQLATLLATNQVTVFVAPQQAAATFAAQTLLGAGNEAAATVAVTSTNLASLFDDQFAKLVIKSINGLTQEQTNALMTQLASLGSDVATVKANLPALLATNQVSVFVGPHQAPATFAAQTLLGAGNESAATIAVTNANLASLFDDQFAKMVIRSVEGLTQEQINALITQLTTLGSDVATVKTNLPALLATNQVAVFVGPHQETFVSSAMNIETGQVADIAGRSIIDIAGIDALTGDQLGNSIFVSRQNIPESEYQTIRQEFIAANLSNGLSAAKSNPTNTTILNQVKTTIKAFMQKTTILAKVDVYAPAAAPVSDPILAQIQAIVIPGESLTNTSKTGTSQTDYDLVNLLARRITATLKAGASDPSNIISQINNLQGTLKAYYFNGSTLSFGASIADLTKIKQSLIQGLTNGILEVTIAP